MRGKIFACVAAVIGAAALTLAIVLILVEGSIRVVAIESLPLRIVAIVADVILGTGLLVGCIYLATHLAVRILGVGHAEFPPLPKDLGEADLPKNE